MKTKELIAQLQKEDPSGELDVCVHNVSVSFVHREPAYWDGAMQLVIRDEAGYPIGGKYKRKGEKVQIETLDFKTMLWDRPEIQIDYSELDEERAKSNKISHDELRRELYDLEYELELETFIEFINEIKEVPKEVCKKFFDDNELTKDKNLVDGNESIHCRRKQYWASKIGVNEGIYFYDKDNTRRP